MRKVINSVINIGFSTSIPVAGRITVLSAGIGASSLVVKNSSVTLFDITEAAAGTTINVRNSSGAARVLLNGSGEVRCGDFDFKMNFISGTTPQIDFDSNDFLAYTRATNSFGFNIGNAESLVIEDGYVNVKGSGGLAVDGQIYQTSIPSQTPTGTTASIDFNTGMMHIIDLGSASGTVVLTLNNPQQGASYIVKIRQGPTTRDISWPGTVFWSGGGAPVITVTDNAEDVVSLIYDGTNFYGTFSQDFS